MAKKTNLGKNSFCFFYPNYVFLAVTLEPEMLGGNQRL